MESRCAVAYCCARSVTTGAHRPSVSGSVANSCSSVAWIASSTTSRELAERCADPVGRAAVMPQLSSWPC